MDIAVVGAGAAGLMASGLLANRGENVVCFDHNEKAGKKLYITGKGRCNFTNLCEPVEFLSNVVRGEKFLRSSIYNFTPQNCIDFFESLGLESKVERGNRAFPQSDKSSDVIKALERHCKEVKFKFGSKITSIYKNGEKFVIVLDGEKLTFDRVILATGGVSYSATGSDGSGYRFAKAFGHTINELVPALCPIKIKGLKQLQGLSLKNVTLKGLIDGKKREFFGEMLFTDEGISGPIALMCSSYINRAKEVKLSLDLKPALDYEKLDARLLRDFDENKNKNISYVFKGLLPSSLVPVFAERVGIALDKKVNAISREERKRILETLKDFKLDYCGLYDINAGIVTSGGVELSEVNPKTFESKLVSGLYLIGEMLDVDALTGGFNLQIAFATAYSCAENM